MKLVPEPIRKARYESSILFPDSEKRKQDYLPPKGEKKKKLTKKGKHLHVHRYKFTELKNFQ